MRLARDEFSVIRAAWKPGYRTEIATAEKLSGILNHTQGDMGRNYANFAGRKRAVHVDLGLLGYPLFLTGQIRVRGAHLSV